MLANGSASRFPTSEKLAEVFYKAATDDKPQMRYLNSLGDRTAVHFARSHPKLLKMGILMALRRINKKR